MRRIVLFAVLGLSGLQVGAQVRCTMPNGVVIEQQLSDQCPHGARQSQTLDGREAPVKGVVKLPPQQVRRDSLGRGSLRVLEGEYGRDWPFTISEGVLRCWTPVGGMPQVKAYTIESGGYVYALNGVATAHAARMGWHELASIWRNNHEIQGTKIPVNKLIARAATVCR